MEYAYPVSLEPDHDGGVVVSFPDVPEAHTQGEDREDALEQAEDALVVALGLYVDGGAALPRPSPADGRPVVAVPAGPVRISVRSAWVDHVVGAQAIGKRSSKRIAN